MRAAVLLVLCSSISYAETPKPEKPPALTKADPVPPVKGAVYTLEEAKSASIGGIKVTFTHASHKHMASGSGPSPGMWGFDFFKGSKQQIELRHTESGFESEVVAHGVVLLFHHLAYTKFQITLAGKAGKPLDDEGCEKLIDAAAEKRRFPTDDSASLSEQNGIVEKHTPTWRGFCGTLTRRVWFAPPRLRARE